MAVKMIGTVMPTSDTYRLSQSYADNVSARQAKVGALIENVTQRNVGGEVRYYRNAKRYAVISSRTFEVLWFETRDDGYDYPAK